MLNDVQSLGLFNVLFIASQIFGTLSFILTIVWMLIFEKGYAWSSEPDLQFHYHPTLMVMSFLFSTGEALLVYRFFRTESKRSTKLIHTALHTVTLIFIILSLKAVWDSHNYHRDSTGALDPLPNLYSIHSWIGITVVISYFLQYFIGFGTYLYPGLSQSLRAMLMPFHKFCGLIIFAFVIITILMGISEFSAWHNKCWTDEKTFCGKQGIANIVGLCTVLYGGLVVALVINPRWHRKPLPEEESLCEDDNINY